ncbi:MAG: hypothetical protein NTX25_22510 [Proteobacteria bacterium]|nr:hypothetical protein [Pseudomonadota bacterium]
MQKSGVASCLSLLLLSLSHSAFSANYSLGLDYSSPFENGDPAMSFSTSMSFSLSEDSKIQIGQALEKNLYIDASTDEWELADTVVAWNLSLKQANEGLSLKLRLQTSLPSSNASRLNEIYTKPELRLSSGYALSPGFQLGLDVFLRAVLSRYDSTPIENNEGGVPLPRYSYGIGHAGNWQAFPNWTAAYQLSYSEIIYYDVNYQGPGPITQYNLPDQAYSLGLSLNWEFIENSSLSAGYSYGALLQQPGLEDFVFFDNEQSRRLAIVSD